MRHYLTLLKKGRYSLFLFTSILFFSSSCMGGGGGGTGDCKKCIENKPAPTPFSTNLNAINHAISVEQALTMINNFNATNENMLVPEFKDKGTLPLYETFNLKAIDTLICQKNAIGFRIYLAMDNQQKVRMVLVGVDPDGKDLLQRKQENPGAVLDANETSVLLEEAGQRWP